MWHGKRISLVIPTYREKDSIRKVIDDFLSTEFIDEVIVVNNNAEKGTNEEIQKVRDRLKVTVIYEKQQGYGYALQMGMLAASGDYVVTIEPDGTYIGNDLKKFLVFAEEFPVIFGSRTIEKTKNKDWGYWRREVNLLYGVCIHLLFNTNVLTDTGCTYKLLHRDAIEILRTQWRYRSSYFATELLLLVVANNIKFIEVPVTFKARVGKSTVVTGGFRLFQLGLVGLRQIMEIWIYWVFKKK